MNRVRFDRVGNVVEDTREYLPVSQTYKWGDQLRATKKHSPAYWRLKAKRSAGRLRGTS